MNWRQNVYQMMGAPVGISFIDGTGTSGVLCGVDGQIVYLVEYLYQKQFALKKYPFYMIQDVNVFPPCHINERYS